MTTNLELRDSDLDTRRYILEPTTASARLACRSAATWTFITAGDRIRALTARHPIKPISASCRSAWQPNLGRRSTYRCGNSVQTTGTTSLYVLADGRAIGRNSRRPAQLLRLLQHFMFAPAQKAS